MDRVMGERAGKLSPFSPNWFYTSSLDMEMDRVMGVRTGNQGFPNHFFREGNGSGYGWKSWKPNQLSHP